jgi:uncharacterized membrane protein YgaE (UPF0421/DUF939 family)
VRTRWAELRTWAASVDPGLTRLHLASVATASMIVAAVLMSVVRTATGQPVTVVMFAVVLAMISNLAVNEPQLHRRRVTTALMALPAAGATTVSTLLGPQRILADAVFVLVMIVAVGIRRYGPRGMALGMAAFMPYFFVLFLQAGVAELPYLLVGVVVGIGSTFVLRCLVFTAPAQRVVDRLVRAFEARLHGLALSVLEVLESDRASPSLDEVRERQARLNETALLVADRLDDIDADGRAEASAMDAGEPGGEAARAAPDGADGLRRWIVDSELAGERLAVATRRMVGHGDVLAADDRAALADGVRAIVAATAVGTPHAMSATLYDTARSAVDGLVRRPAGVDAAARVQRIAFAVLRLADAVQTTVDQVRDRLGRQPGADGVPGGHESGREPDPDERTDRTPGRYEAGPGPADDEPAGPPDVASGPGLYNRQAVQVGVATSLAIIAGELISPARWYWAVIAAFVVFAGTSSRGDVLSRGWARVIGTAGGLVAGMLLAFAVGGNLVASLVLLFACVFLALYLVRISQAMMAFWITAVLALLYGVIGQFSVTTLVLRLEETVAGGVLGILAAFVVLPTRSRTAFGEALDDALTSTADGVAAVVDRVLGRQGEDPLEIARRLDGGLGTVRTRARPLEHPVARRPLRRGVRHTVRVVAGMDHYVRSLAVTARTIRHPAWAATLDPAARRVRDNLDGLRRILLRGYGPRSGRDDDPGTAIESAEELIDAAEAAASAGASDDRTALLAIARMLRRIDQLACGLARELTGGAWSEPDPDGAAPAAGGDRVGPATPRADGPAR